MRVGFFYLLIHALFIFFFPHALDDDDDDHGGVRRDRPPPHASRSQTASRARTRVCAHALVDAQRACSVHPPTSSFQLRSLTAPARVLFTLASHVVPVRLWFVAWRR